MQLALYTCSQCGHILRRNECILHDDPMAAFGPELLCPQCEGLVVSRHHPGVVVLIALAIIGLSVWVGLYVF